MSNPNLNFTDYSSKEGQSLVQTNEWTSNLISKPLDCAESLTEINIDLRKKSAPNIQIDMISESLEGLYRKLEEMEQTNAIQFRNIVENNKKTDKCLQDLKEQEEATKIELQGMRKRFESFEKKRHLGYYN